MIAFMVRATGALLILAGAALYGASPAYEALLCQASAAQRPDEAIPHCTAAIEMGGLSGGDLAAVLANRCLAYGKKDDYARAWPDCERAIQLAPQAALPVCQRGWVRHYSGNADGAMLDFEQAIRLDPDLATAYTGRGSVYAGRRQYDQAVQDYGVALGLKPDDAAFYGRGWCEMQKGRYESARQDFDQAVSLGAGAKAYHARGYCYARDGNYSLAIADLDEALRLRPNFVAAYKTRAWVYGRRRDWDQAIRDCTAALRVRPDAEMYNARGWAYYHKGAYLLALWDFGRASWRYWTPLVLAVGLIYLLGRFQKPKQPESPTEEGDVPPAADDSEPFPESSDVEALADAEAPEPSAEPPDAPSAATLPHRDSSEDADLDVLIRTGLRDGTAIGLAESLLSEAGIPFFVMDQNVAARQESGNIAGWWNARVPREREAEAREIVRAVEAMK